MSSSNKVVLYLLVVVPVVSDEEKKTPALDCFLFTFLENEPREVNMKLNWQAEFLIGQFPMQGSQALI